MTLIEDHALVDVTELTKALWRDFVKILMRKPRHTSFFSCNALIPKIQFLKKIPVSFLRSLRLQRSNNLETQNNENSKRKLVNLKFGVSDLENDLLTSTLHF